MSADKKLPLADDVALVLSDFEGRFWEEVQEAGMENLTNASNKEIGLLLMRLGLVMCLNARSQEKSTPQRHAEHRSDAERGSKVGGSGVEAKP